MKVTDTLVVNILRIMRHECGKDLLSDTVRMKRVNGL